MAINACLLLSGQAVSAQEAKWLAPGNPAISYTELADDYELPTTGNNTNTDCQVRDFDVVTRPFRVLSGWPFIQTEQRHKSSCATHTPRGVTDGEYLDTGDTVAGRLWPPSLNLQPLPNSNMFVAITTVVYGAAQQLTFYQSIVPEYRSNGEIWYHLRPADKPGLTDQAGNTLSLRLGARGYSADGKWMIAESPAGFIRVNTETGFVIPFAPAVTNHHGWGPTQRLAISPDGRYAVVAYGTSFKIYDINTCGPVPDTITGPVPCQYKDVEPLLKNTFSSYETSYQIRFAAEDLLTFISEHKVSGTTKRAAVRMAPPGQTLEDISYLALGDSFSSGEGAYDYERGTDEPENKCHLSRKSYPYVVAQKLDMSRLRNVSCSGAKFSDYFSSQDGMDDNANNSLGEWLPGAKPQYQYLEKATPSVVTISMIGNDIGFADKLKRCIIGPGSCFRFREERESIAHEIYRKFGTLVGLYKHIQYTAPDANIYVLGYPQIFSSSSTCGGVGGLSAWLDTEERLLARGMVTYLNAVIKTATEKAGVVYIDVEDSFAGRQLCDAGTKAVNGLTRGDDIPSWTGFGPIGNESFHPNATGHQIISQNILSQSLNLSKPMPESQDIEAPGEGSAAYDALIGNAPSGSIFRRLIYTTLRGQDIINKASPLRINPTEAPLKPSTPFDNWLFSEPVFLGTLYTDETVCWMEKLSSRQT